MQELLLILLFVRRKKGCSWLMTIICSKPTCVTEWHLLPQPDAHTLRALLLYIYRFVSLSFFISYLLAYLLTYPMQQNPSWEANRFSASPESPHILWSLKVHYYINTCPPPVPTRSPTLLPKGRKVNFRNRHLLWWALIQLYRRFYSDLLDYLTFSEQLIANGQIKDPTFMK